MTVLPSRAYIVVRCGGSESCHLHGVSRNLPAALPARKPSPPMYGSATPATRIPVTSSTPISLTRVLPEFGRVGSTATGYQRTGASFASRLLLGPGSGAEQQADGPQAVQVVDVRRQ